MIVKHGEVTVKKDGKVLIEGFHFDSSDGSNPEQEALVWAFEIIKSRITTRAVDVCGWCSGNDKEGHDISCMRPERSGPRA